MRRAGSVLVLLILSISSCRRAAPPEVISIKALVGEGRLADAENAFDNLPETLRKKNKDLLCDLGRGVLKYHSKNPEKNLRYHAMIGFHELENKEDMGVFREALQDPFYKVQLVGAEALGDWNDDSYKGTLYGLLEAEDEEARFLAAAILLKFGDLRGLPQLFRILVVGVDPRNRRKAAAALGEWAPDDKTVADHLKLAALKDPNLFVRIDALKALGQREGPKEALAGLRALKQSGNKYVAIRALASLSFLGDAEATEELLKHIRDQDQQIRLEALLTAADLGFPEAFPLLEHVLTAEDIPSRSRAVLLLGDTGDSKYLPEMKKVFREIEDRVLRINFVKAMTEVAKEEDLWFMKDLVPNPDPFVEIYAARALCLIYNRYK